MRVRAHMFVWMFMHALACVIYCVYISTRTFLYMVSRAFVRGYVQFCVENFYSLPFSSYLLFVCSFYPEGVTCFSLRQKQRLRFPRELSYSALRSIITAHPDPTSSWGKKKWKLFHRRSYFADKRKLHPLKAVIHLMSCCRLKWTLSTFLLKL